MSRHFTNHLAFSVVLVYTLKPGSLYLRGQIRVDVINATILAKNLTVRSSCYENVSEAELKSNGLSCLAEEISRQYNIKATALFLPIVLIQIYNEGEQKNMKSMQFNKVEACM